jgi:hypothetical protein
MTMGGGHWEMNSELGIARSAVFGLAFAQGFGLAFGESFEGMRGGDWGATFGFESEPAFVPTA